MIIALVGMLSREAAVLRKKLPGVTILHHSGDRTPPLTPVGDYCIVVTRFTSHSWSAWAKRGFGRRMIWCNGGLSSILATIRELEAAHART